MTEKRRIIDNQEIIHGDCLNVLSTFDDQLVDLVITSPPYNIGVKYNKYDDKKDSNAYLEWLRAIFTNINRILKDNGSIFLNIGNTNINPWISFDVANTLRDMFVLQNNIIWVKSISIKETTYGHFKPVNSNRFLNHTFENIFHFTKHGNVVLDRKSIGVPYMAKVNLKAKTVTEDLRCKGNCWFIPYKTIQSRQERGDHPATFPDKLVENCIKLHGYNEDTVVCDPFLGHGTTLLVSKHLGTKGIGIEIDEKYFEYSYQRLLSEHGILTC